LPQPGGQTERQSVHHTCLHVLDGPLCHSTPWPLHPHPITTTRLPPRDRTLVPGRLFWNKSNTSYPSNSKYTDVLWCGCKSRISDSTSCW
jgi:hypothetical protein